MLLGVVEATRVLAGVDVLRYLSQLGRALVEAGEGGGRVNLVHGCGIAANSTHSITNYDKRTSKKNSVNSKKKLVV